MQPGFSLKPISPKMKIAKHLYQGMISKDRMKGRRKLCIYLVDDEATLAEMAEHILALHGHKPTVFTDPVRALKQITARKIKPHLLITDFLMGCMTGLELIEEYKAAHPDGKTLLLSGTITDDQIASARVRPDRFLAKPYSAEDLVQQVNELVNELSEEA